MSSKSNTMRLSGDEQVMPPLYWFDQILIVLNRSSPSRISYAMEQYLRADRTIVERLIAPGSLENCMGRLKNNDGAPICAITPKDSSPSS